MTTESWFAAPPLRTPDPEAALAVAAIRDRVRAYATADGADLARARREKRIRRLCELNFDLAVCRQITAILDGEA